MPGLNFIQAPLEGVAAKSAATSAKLRRLTATTGFSPIEVRAKTGERYEVRF
jgi:hypothetical protein